VSAPVVADADLAPPPRPPRRPSWETSPTWLLGGVIAVAGLLLFFHYGTYYWFRGDEWIVIADPHRADPAHLLEPHGGSHLIAVPKLIYLALWQLVGVRTYWPYQLLVVLTHMVTAALLYAVMCRSGVRRWLAFAAVSLFVLVGPGAKNTVWAFQVGFNGSLAWGLAHLLLANHPGRFDRRDALGLVCGFLAISSSGVGISLTGAVVVATLLRRGWKLALVHGMPLAAYGVWLVLADARSSGPFGRPPLHQLVAWAWSSALGMFLELGRFEALAWVLVVVLGVGLVVKVVSGEGRGALARDLAMPVGLAVGALFFVISSGMVRSWGGDAFARGDRYMYLEAALLLPLIAVAAEALARRWRVLAPVLVLLFLVPIPFNLTRFDQGAFDQRWMDKQEYILTTAPRLPFAHDVPRDVVPAVDSGAVGAVPIGFLLTAVRNGDLTPSTVELTPRVVNEFSVRLGVAQRMSADPLTECVPHTEAVDLSPPQGEVLHIGSPVLISTVDGGERTSPSILYDPMAHGSELTIELPDLHLRFEPPPRAASFRLCTSG
jgi:hypothetical protein